MPRTPRAVLAALLVLLPLTAACTSGGLPGREPDVTGTVLGLALAEASDRYYDQMSLAGDDDTTVRAADGEEITTADLRDGDDVDVWVDDGCAESLPVRCGIETIRVRG
ncbi:hypothetical protein ACWFNE_18535 [Cellulomonas sp. NPDC055163]